jgi:hypothetical protein
VMFVEESFRGIGARRGKPEVNSYIDPLSASEPEPVGRAAAGQAPQHNSAKQDSVREANIDHVESVPPASWSRSAWPTPATMQCNSNDEPDANNDGGADEAADNYKPLTEVGRGSGRTQVLQEHDIRLGHPGINETNFGNGQPRAELWAAARLARVRKPVIRHTDGPGLVATSEVRAPGGPFIIALGAGPRRAGDLITELASMSGAPVSIVLIDPAIGGASHDLSNESVVSNLIHLAAGQDCVAVIASPPRRSF